MHQFQTIVSSRSVEGLLGVKFFIELIRPITQHGVETCSNVAWRFSQPTPESSSEFFVTQVSESGMIVLPNPISLITKKLQQANNKPTKVIRFVSYSLFDDEDLQGLFGAAA